MLKYLWPNGIVCRARPSPLPERLNNIKGKHVMQLVLEYSGFRPETFVSTNWIEDWFAFGRECFRCAFQQSMNGNCLQFMAYRLSVSCGDGWRVWLVSRAKWLAFSQYIRSRIDKFHADTIANILRAGQDFREESMTLYIESSFACIHWANMNGEKVDKPGLGVCNMGMIRTGAHICLGLALEYRIFHLFVIFIFILIYTFLIILF